MASRKTCPTRSALTVQEDEYPFTKGRREGNKASERQELPLDRSFSIDRECQFKSISATGTACAGPEHVTTGHPHEQAQIKTEQHMAEQG